MFWRVKKTHLRRDCSISEVTLDSEEDGCPLPSAAQGGPCLSEKWSVITTGTSGGLLPGFFSTAVIHPRIMSCRGRIASEDPPSPSRHRWP